jgi:hypothetical protein
MPVLAPEIGTLLRQGTVIPAHPLALTRQRKLDERYQRALARYYIEAGAGGLAVGVHTTQFAIHQPQIGLYQPVLALAAEEMQRAGRPLIQVAGVVGSTAQAVREAQMAGDLGYHAVLLGFHGLQVRDDDALIEHCRQIGQVLPVVGFYLQPAVGGRELPYSFWRRFAEMEQVIAIKIAPFDRYRTLDVVRAVVDAQRDDIALYTGNDDAIVSDLITPFCFRNGPDVMVRRIVGGLLGHWAVWTRRAVELLAQCHRASRQQEVPADLLRVAAQVTDCNSAIFDAAHRFAGCNAGILEVLRRQGLVERTWCLDGNERLSAGQSAEIDRVCRAYPHLMDDAFVAQHRDRWLG